jgi:hypothetical protein
MINAECFIVGFQKQWELDNKGIFKKKVRLSFRTNSSFELVLV